METSISSVRIIGGHSAIEDGTAIVKNTNGVIMSQASYTAIHLKEGDKWLMASVTGTCYSLAVQAAKLRTSGVVDRRLECSKGLQDPGTQFQMDCG